MCGNIYKITNILTNKVYVGQTKKSITQRFSEHKHHAKVKDDKLYLHLAMNKYGIDNFKVELIEECDTKEKLNNREKYWIRYYKSNKKEFGYNLTKGGDGCPIEHHSKETIEKLSIISRKKWQDNKYKEKVRKRMSESHLGKSNKSIANKINVNNGKVFKYIFREELEEYLKQGWKIGSLRKSGKNNKGKVYIHKKNQIKAVNLVDLQNYLNGGWVKGNPNITKRNEKYGSNTKNRFRVFKESVVKYVKFEDVENYLNDGWEVSKTTMNKYRKLITSRQNEMQMSIYGRKESVDEN